MNKVKYYFYSPLIGAIFSTMILFLFSVITIIQSNSDSLVKVISGGLTVLPILFIIIYVVSLLLFLISNNIIKLLRYRYFISEGFTWFIGFLLGLLIAILLLLLTKIEILSFKGLSICLSMSFGLMFNMSLFSVLSGKIKSKRL